jgi:hypothetical protein
MFGGLQIPRNTQFLLTLIYKKKAFMLGEGWEKTAEKQKGLTAVKL